MNTFHSDVCDPFIVLVKDLSDVTKCHIYIDFGSVSSHAFAVLLSWLLSVILDEKRLRDTDKLLSLI